MIKLLLIISQLTYAFNNCTIRQTDYIDTHDFITHKIRNTNCYDAHNPPRLNGTTRIAVSLFIADMDSISEQTMDQGFDFESSELVVSSGLKMFILYDQRLYSVLVLDQTTH